MVYLAPQMQTAISDEQHVHGSRPYQVISDQVALLKNEADRYRLIIDQLQVSGAQPSTPPWKMK